MGPRTFSPVVVRKTRPTWTDDDLRALGDLGYEGEAGTIAVAFKKPKNATCTNIQQQFNRCCSSGCDQPLPATTLRHCAVARCSYQIFSTAPDNRNRPRAPL